MWYIAFGLDFLESKVISTYSYGIEVGIRGGAVRQECVGWDVSKTFSRNEVLRFECEGQYVVSFGKRV